MKTEIKETSEVVIINHKTKSALFQELYRISLSGLNTESRLNKIIEKHDFHN